MQKSEDNKIIWEKWVDPFGQNIDDMKWSKYDDLEDEDSDEDSALTLLNNGKKINAIATHMGIIPYNEYTDCSKIFNFWVGHTNFDITQNIVDIIESIQGVETLDIFTRYRFRVAFGKSFNDRDIMNKINTTLYKEFITNDNI